MMKILLASALLLCSSIGWAQVLEVNIWQPMPGMSEQTIAYAKEAEGIANDLGGGALVGQDRNGSLHFVTTHKNWAEWAAFPPSNNPSRKLKILVHILAHLIFAFFYKRDLKCGQSMAQSQCGRSRQQSANGIASPFCASSSVAPLTATRRRPLRSPY